MIQDPVRDSRYLIYVDLFRFQNKLRFKAYFVIFKVKWDFKTA